MEDQPVLEIRPVVIPGQFFLWAPLIAAFASVFPGMFAFVGSNIVAAIAGDDMFDGPIVWFGLVVYVGSFAAAMYLLYLKMFIEPLRTSYTVFKDRLEYDEGLLNRHRRTVVFDQIIDVQLAEGLLQQTKGAGTITIITQHLVSSGEGSLSNRQISLRNVPEPRRVYDLICSLVRK